LPNAQRGLIEASKPYQGGNQMLWTLHRLDIKTTENQQRELQNVITQRDGQQVEVYADHGISGAKGRDKRLAFDNLIKDARDASKS
jgi:DNA invertase Pin-like site-specific DNA recombinase